MNSRASTIMDPQTLWTSVLETLRGFEGELPFAIRTDLFFHLSLASASPGRYRAKNYLWPALAFARTLRQAPSVSRLPVAATLAVCDYPAEAGFGTLRPLLRSLEKASLLVNEPVWHNRKAEIHQLGIACASLDKGISLAELREGFAASRQWTAATQQAAAPELREILHSSRHVVGSMVCRAAIYRRRLTQALRQVQPQCVVTHNDFTTMSYLAGAVAREAGVPDVTLQHGLVSREYLPVTASHYFTWGQFHSGLLTPGCSQRTIFHPVGAPRLDRTTSLRIARRTVEAGKTIRVLFLSQMHSLALDDKTRHTLFHLLGEVARLQNVEVHVRRHPQERSRFDAQYQAAGLSLRPAPETLADALQSTDMVLSASATAGIEAAMMGVPVLMLPSEFPHGLSRIAQNIEEVCSALDALRTPSTLNSWLREQQEALRQIMTNPGHATEAALAEINSLPRGNLIG